MCETEYELVVVRQLEHPAFLEPWSALVADHDFAWFQSPGWVIPWCRMDRAGHQSFMLGLYHKTELVCFAPWCFSSGTLFSMGDPLNDVNGLIIKRGYDSSLITRILFERFTSLLPKGFQRLILDCCPNELPQFGLGSFRIKRQPDVASPVIDTLSSREHYLSSLTASRVRKMAQLWRKIKRDLPGASFEIASDTNRAIDLAVMMLQLREEGLGPRGFLEDCEPSSRAAPFQDFVIDLILSDSTPRHVLVSAITHNREVLAVGLYFQWNKTLMKYMQGWSLTHKSLSLGSSLDVHMIEYCLKRGIQSLELGRGEEQYKSWLGARSVSLYSYDCEIE